jgi:hypothetical protein
MARVGVGHIASRNDGQRVRGAGRRSAMQTRARIVGGVIAAVLLLAGTVARAEQYPGWGDTGWVYASKRDCCDAAIDIAAEYSAQACLTSGGVPRAFAGASQRGTCKSDWMQNDGALLYRCYGEASVWCR